MYLEYYDLVKTFHLTKQKVVLQKRFMIGDDYEMDIVPAESVGITGIEVRKVSGRARHHIESLFDLPKLLKVISQ